MIPRRGLLSLVCMISIALFTCSAFFVSGGAGASPPRDSVLIAAVTPAVLQTDSVIQADQNISRGINSAPFTLQYKYSLKNPTLQYIQDGTDDGPSTVPDQSAIDIDLLSASGIALLVTMVIGVIKGGAKLSPTVIHWLAVALSLLFACLGALAAKQPLGLNTFITAVLAMTSSHGLFELKQTLAGNRSGG